MKNCTLLLAVVFYQLFSCVYAANYNGTLGSQIVPTLAQVIIDNKDGEGTLRLKGASYTIQSFYTIQGYAHTVIFISDMIVGNKTLEILPVPGTNVNGRSIVKAERFTWKGNSGVLFWFAPTGVWYTPQTSAQPGQVYDIDLILKVRATTAIQAGVSSSTIKIGSEEYFSDSLDSNVLQNLSFGGASNLTSSTVGVTAIGYCTSGNDYNPTIVLDHGLMSANNIDGNSKNATFSFECNTTALPKVYFQSTMSNQTDILLCDGVKSSLSANTITESEFKFKTTFNSTLHRTGGEICSGKFSGSTVATISFD